ncbi:something about silencing, SAS, complex subunit 4-domain-containing protein [Chaetomium fimeti]|uniref:Something about silencing, SAS, complex subunit 4-domain-containing protein n=1 Tax=Chaetomium fimeti TaxID=1854472 RepID=A0AAE0HQX1_9PEZI|nr:something about silencing, SAS, complex subunit 4-domain-containing protein [Chaetomium fimeti]
MALTASMTRARKLAATGHPFSKANSHYAPRPKRQRDHSERDFENIVAKKSKLTTGIAVEIPARSSLHARFTNDDADTADTSHANSAPTAPIAATNAPASHRVPNGPKPAPGSSQQQQQQQQRRRPPTPTKHRSKVSKGLKHELDRLQPNEADTKDQGRKLRSQEAIRFKSELSSYFPEYDEVIGNDPKETHFLNADTPIVIIPDAPPPTQQPAPHPASPTPGHQHNNYPTRSYSDALYTDLFDAQRIDFSFLSNPAAATSDPLPDTLFAPAHKKAERTERSIRNTEKGRAQHERDQIVRLLDALQGHDWLRVMGVSGVTEPKKRAFEPARAHFVRGCEAILDKFRRWSREEKRRRAELLERRQAFLSGGEGSTCGEGVESDEEGEGEEAEEEGDARRSEGGGESGEEVEDADDVEDEPPDESDVDASIAKQLREEALAAAAKKRRAKPGGKAAAAKRATTTARGKSAAAPVSHVPAAARESAEPPREIVSFFRKRYQRDAALSTNRRKGRTVLAWGEPLPEMPEAEFELPAALRDDDSLRSPPRKKRRAKRVKE